MVKNKAEPPAEKKDIEKTDMANQKMIIERLADTYADTGSALHFDSVFELLVAVILSAQTNDNQVNKITEALFKKHPDAASFSCVNAEELEQYIKTCGLYKNKAKNIIAACRIITDDYGGQVPKTREDLEKLPGVGRKTASVILSVGFGQPALAVDTHVFRVSRRMGLSSGTTVDKVEHDLCALIPEKQWGEAHHWLIWHGRRACTARNPACGNCPVANLCPSSVALKNKITGKE